MSSPNCCFLTCVQISQEAGEVAWCSRLCKSFPQCVMMHTVKGFSIVNEAEIDVFLEFPCFLYDPVNVGNLISGASAFSKSSVDICKFWVHILLKPTLRVLSITSPACELRALVWQFEHSQALPFFGIGHILMRNKTWQQAPFAAWCERRLSSPNLTVSGFFISGSRRHCFESP